MLRHTAGSAEADKQALYGGVGVLLALVISRIDYSRLREYKLGLYAVMIGLDLVVYGFAPIAGRGAGSRCRGSASSPRSSASCC